MSAPGISARTGPGTITVSLRDFGRLHELATPATPADARFLEHMAALAGISHPACRNCGEPRRRQPTGRRRWQGAHGWCGACTSRWYRAGKPASGVPPLSGETERVSRSAQGARAAQLARAEDYAELLSWGLPRAEAMARTGIRSEGTARRYDALIAAGALDELREAS